MLEETGIFKAIGDNKYIYTVYVFTDLTEAGRYEDINKVMPDIRQFCTSDGRAVKRLQKGEYQIVETGVILRSLSSDAP